MRYPGHLAAIRTLKALGFFSETPITVDGHDLAPRRLTEPLLEPLLVGDTPIEDVVVVRVHCTAELSRRGMQVIRSLTDLAASPARRPPRPG